MSQLNSVVQQAERDNQRTCYFLDRSVDRLARVTEETEDADANKDIDDVGEAEDEEIFQESGIKAFKSSSLQLETKPIDGNTIPFVRLLAGHESKEAALQRWDLYNKAWSSQQERINNLLKSSNSKVLDSIMEFISQPWDNDIDSCVETAILLPGSNIANHLRLFSQIRSRIDEKQDIYQVSLNSRDSVNLKTALKIIVGKMVDQTQDQETFADGDEEMDEDDNLKFDRRIRYDLEILAEWYKKLCKSSSNSSEIRLIVIIEDADSFDIPLLTDLIKMFQSYISQIPVKLLISVATSLDIFQEKISRSCLRLIRGTVFEAQMLNGLSEILDQTMFAFDKYTLLLGPNLFANLVQRQNQSMASIDAFISSMKYVYMAHYYSNPFALLSQHDVQTDQENTLYVEQIKMLISPSHIKAIRMLPSFRQFIEAKVALKETEEVKQLLKDDEYLKSIILMVIIDFRDYVETLFDFMDTLIFIQQALDSTVDLHLRSRVDLYPEAMSGKLFSGGFKNHLFKHLTKCKPHELQRILNYLSLANTGRKSVILKDTYIELISTFPSEIKQLEQNIADMTVTQKIVTNLVDIINQRFAICDHSYKTFLLHEVFVTDLAGLQENVFIPTQRPALETALLHPEHYLGWVDRDSDNLNDKHLDPFISILFLLYRESSVFINIYDWYMAFKETVRNEKEEDHEWDKRVLAWFLQGVAELKLLGIVRDSKRKFECVEKIVWMGL